MALIRSNTYAGRYDAPTAAQPQGAFRNRTTQTSEDGSYLEAQWVNDWSAFFSSMMENANISYNGNVDSVGNCQYFDAMTAVINAEIDASPTFVKKSGDTMSGNLISEGLIYSSYVSSGDYLVTGNGMVRGRKGGAWNWYVGTGLAGDDLYLFSYALDKSFELDAAGEWIARGNSRYQIYHSGDKPTPADIGAVPTSRTINGSPLSSNITLDAADVGAVPTTRTVNGSPLSSNITLDAADVGALPTSFISKSGSSNGYLRVDDVFIQWMRVPVQTANDWTTINFPISFPNRCGSVSIIYQSSTPTLFTQVVQRNSTSGDRDSVSFSVNRAGTYMITAVGN